ncbi:hypothetical protein [Promicromonospora iranensis]|uniref:LPXTG-motif cell wall-anchored protein n=1 Tax=Promicromonospora iranensis TaxID=1105144 RepID=A0ABU2CSV8_9MICO|nr:hypothetical protein [Promicromonospora iranensis]MDR7384427.1 hypothetical protein [Promicromonospora iranensis]
MRIPPAASVATAPLLLTAALVIGAPSAAAAPSDGSDGPVPYAVTAEGLTLPDGADFADGGHVNVRYTVAGAERSAGIHFETRNEQPSGQYVGESFLPWDELIDDPSYCITWVQVAEYDEHFGEGGQKPVCTDDRPAPTATPTPTTTPTATPTPSATPGPSATTEPAAEPASSDTATEPSPVPSASAGSVAAPSPTTTAATTPATDEDVLAATGSMAVPVTIFAGLLIAAGVVLLVMGRRVKQD